MLKILQLIGGFFTAGGPFLSFFAWVGVKFSSKAVIVGIQFSTIVLLFAARIAFLISVLEFARLTYTTANSFVNNLNTFFTSDTLLSLGFRVLQSIGIIDAFKDAFDIFNILFPALLLAWVLKFAYHTSKMTSDEFFKLGMLVQA